MKPKKTYSKNFTLMFSILVIFVTSTLTYLFTNIVPRQIWVRYAVLVLGIINVSVTLYPLTYFVLFGSQNKVIKQFMRILFNALFLDHIMNQKNKEDFHNYAYRITYYKYYDKHSKWFFIYRIWWNIHFYKYPIRKLESNYDYLICKYRYGIENGTYITQKTSKAYRIYEDENFVRGVTGKIYKNDSSVYFCINNFNVNSILKKILDHKTKHLSTYDDSLKDKSINDNIAHMKSFLQMFNKSSKIVISDDEINALTKFMKETNTDFNDIFNVNNGIHSNHFLGFKVYNKLHETIGVFTIDAKEDDLKTDFEDIVAKAETNWMGKILTIFSGLTSQTIIDILSEEDKQHGERIRD